MIRLAIFGALGKRGTQWAAEAAANSRFTLEQHFDPRLADQAPPDWATLDGVIIASPTETHLDLIIEAAAHRVAVLVEKPVAPSFPEFAAGLPSVQSSIVRVGYSEVFSPAWRALQREIVRSGARVVSAQFRRFSQARSTGADVIGDLMVHDLALARSLEPDVFDGAAVRAVAMDELVDLVGVDSAAAVMTHPSGVSFWLEASRMATIDPLRRARVATTRGVFEVNLRAHTLTLDGAPRRVDTRISAMALTLDSFADAISGYADDGVTLDEAYYVERAAEAVRRSAMFLTPIGG